MDIYLCIYLIKISFMTRHGPSCPSRRQFQSDLDDSSYPLDKSSCHLNDLLD